MPGDKLEMAGEISVFSGVDRCACCGMHDGRADSTSVLAGMPHFACAAYCIRAGIRNPDAQAEKSLTYSDARSGCHPEAGIIASIEGVFDSLTPRARSQWQRPGQRREVLEPAELLTRYMQRYGSKRNITKSTRLLLYAV